MNLKSRKSGISLISLIITIIVIIILAAIVIFSGMDTPEKAQLSKVISDIDNVQTAVDQAYYGLYTEKAVAGEVWTKSQFYEAVATGEKNRDNLTGTGLIEIGENSLVDINLPVYEGRKWYVAVSDVSDTVKVGSAVLSPGFGSQGKTYATLLDIQTGGSDGSGANGGSQGGLTEEDLEKLSQIEVGDFVNYIAEGTPDDLKGNWRVLEIGEDGNITLYLERGDDDLNYCYTWEEYFRLVPKTTISIKQFESKESVLFCLDLVLFPKSSPWCGVLWQTKNCDYELDLYYDDLYCFVNLPAS